jgi:hypothetical protein
VSAQLDGNAAPGAKCLEDAVAELEAPVIDGHVRIA